VKGKRGKGVLGRREGQHLLSERPAATERWKKKRRAVGGREGKERLK